jgi:hypothetical protein
VTDAETTNAETTNAADQRLALSELGAQSGWRRNEYQRVDVYVRGIHHVHAIWRDAAVLNGGSHYEDAVLMSYTRDLAKVRSWLAK